MIALARAALTAAVLQAACLLTGSALAHTEEAPGAVPAPATRPPEGPRGRIAVKVANGGAVVRMAPTEGPFLGASFVVTNVGDGPLTVRRVAFLSGDEGTPRTPPGVSASLEKGKDSKLAPGESRGVDVRWRADLARAEELVGFVEIESDSAAPGATTFDAPALVGVVADRRSGLARRIASVLVLFPLLAALLAALSSRIRALDGRTMARACAGLFLAHAGLAATAAFWIDPRLSSLDGNGGMQFIEHVALPFGLSWSLGLDGVAMPVVVASTLVVLAAAIAGRRIRLHGERFFIGLSLLSTATTGALIAQDVRLLASFLVLGAPAAYLLVSAGDHPRARRAALAIGSLVLASAVVAAAVLLGLATSAGPGLDLAFGRTASTWQLADLGRVAWTSDSVRLVGLHPSTAAWTLAAIALVVRAVALPPIGGGALGIAPTAATTALLGTALGPLGLLALRLGYGPGSQAASTVAPALLVAGLAVAAIGALSALRARDLVHAASGTVVVQAGLALVALASRTPQGIEGAVSTIAWHGLSAALIVLVAAALRDRVGTSETTRLGGLASEMPRASLLMAVALLAAGGLPGLAGFWGPSFTIFGLVARAPIMALCVAVVLLVQAAALARVHAKVFGGQVPAPWKTSRELEPFGGRFPDLRLRELAGTVVLAAAIVAIGLHPRPLLAPSEVRALELHRRIDAPGPTQIAEGGPGATLPGSCRSSTSSTSATPSCASAHGS